MKLGKYDEGSVPFKVLGDPVRLQIVDLLAQGEMCACDLLQNLSIAQPTLSHHMKALRESGLVHVRKQATWMHYSLDRDSVERLRQTIDALMSPEKQLDPQSIRSDMACCPQGKQQGIQALSHQPKSIDQNHSGRR